MLYLKMSFVYKFAVKDTRLYFLNTVKFKRLFLSSTIIQDNQKIPLDNKIEPSMQGTLPTAVFLISGWICILATNTDVVGNWLS